MAKTGRKLRPRRPVALSPEEAYTAALINAEGNIACVKEARAPRLIKVRRSIRVRLRACSRNMLERAAPVFSAHTKRPPIRVRAQTQRDIACPPELFPPDGKGRWHLEIKGEGAKSLLERLRPLLSKDEKLREYDKLKKTCK